MSERQARLVTITFQIQSRDFGARGKALALALIQSAEDARGVFRAFSFTTGPYTAKTVEVPETNYVLHEHEGHSLHESVDHEHVHDGPHEHPRMGLGALRIRDN